MFIRRVRSYRPKIIYHRVFYGLGVYGSGRTAFIASLMGVQADIVAVFAMLFLAGISMEHNAVTGLTAQDMTQEAGIARIL